MSSWIGPQEFLIGPHTLMKAFFPLQKVKNKCNALVSTSNYHKNEDDFSFERVL